MEDWFAMDDHSFYLYKMEIEHIWFINMFGGAYHTQIEDYNAGQDSWKKGNSNTPGDTSMID